MPNSPKSLGKKLRQTIKLLTEVRSRSHREIEIANFGLYLMLGFAFILLSSVLLGCTPVELSWQDIKSLELRGVPLLEKAIRDNSDLEVSEAIQSAKVVAIAQKDGKTLWLIDYNTPQLCGAKGCLYSIYLEDKNKGLSSVFSEYFYPPPTNNPLFRLSFSSEQDFPCLSVQQSQKNLLQSSIYCYDGKMYELSEKVAIKL